MNDFTLLKFTGESVDIMFKMNPKYKEYVENESGKKLLYVQLLTDFVWMYCQTWRATLAVSLRLA